MKNAFFIVIQIFFFWLINEIGNKIVEFLNLPIPGNVLGMIILFLLLVTHVIPIRYVDLGSNLLIKHLAFFFIPIAVGLMALGSLIFDNMLSFILAIIGSLIVGFITTGYTAQKLSKQGESPGNETSNLTV
ncbi:MAG: Antiholin-like protein LrgA [Bacillales bacterium]|jgi:holin-like protein|nr:Antiholin-like protein LrgA [Bacillales bacterium]